MSYFSEKAFQSVLKSNRRPGKLCIEERDEFYKEVYLDKIGIVSDCNDIVHCTIGMKPRCNAWYVYWV